MHGLNTKPQITRLTKFEPLIESANAMPVVVIQEKEKETVCTDYVKNES